jgi:predicted nucleotidyltransferase component of viral defense system
VLNIDGLPDATRCVFEHLAKNRLLNRFTLIGGTAMALQIAHRKSEDLDFWFFGERMDKAIVSTVIRMAHEAGFDVLQATSHEKIIAERINGRDLMALAQDYVIGGVKVTFFARNDMAYDHFNHYRRVNDGGCSFNIMGEEGLFAMKSHVIHHRVRSRDLYDLMVFVSKGKTLDEIFSAAREADPASSEEYAKSVLVGDVPLDKVDEGFDSIGVAVSIKDVYDFFRSVVNEHEQAVAEKMMREDFDPGM